jgi:dihydrofolate reductase
MLISIIAAVDEHGGLGWQGSLPWRLSADLKRFKSLTMGHHILMGRKTYESIGRVLPGRTTVIITRSPADRPAECSPPHCYVVGSIEAALELARANGETEAFIIGGGEIFAKVLPLADRLYLTSVHVTRPADVFFPEWDEENWREVERVMQTADEQNEYPFTFRLLERVR